MLIKYCALLVHVHSALLVHVHSQAKSRAQFCARRDCSDCANGALWTRIVLATAENFEFGKKNLFSWV